MMTKAQMRSERRYFIGEYLDCHGYTPKIEEITYYVRLLERVNFGYELKAYVTIVTK